MSSGSLADEFAEFYENKITAIRNGISAAPVQLSPLSDVVALHTFALTNAEEVSTLIRKSTSKSSAVDPIPTWLTKTVSSYLLSHPRCHHLCWSPVFKDDDFQRWWFTKSHDVITGKMMKDWRGGTVLMDILLCLQCVCVEGCFPLPLELINIIAYRETHLCQTKTDELLAAETTRCRG
ncbi:hypothetical protein CAPTEDRAFT_195394 [Capitella teleta]|uniref:Uncharacterized protein n=1 Tax=Capitella teleta TaxID=283909 RepID=R7UK88_CAPTE|nr:hypothetical protein CAPTEDRAFT_195394 [Capitella teleta]|eukprot:ELU03697.1 hypothetical protein CAPTEDRAFT_195394 [Capitella teleta]